MRFRSGSAVTVNAQVTLAWTGRAEPPPPAPATLTLREVWRPPPGLLPPTPVLPGRILEGDKTAVAAHLATHEPGQIALFYTDPPFATGRPFALSRGAARASTAKRAYADTTSGGAYLQTEYAFLKAAAPALAPHANVYVHCDWRAAAPLRLILDEIFGPSRFVNEIAWCYREGVNRSEHFNRKHDTLLWYAAGPEYVFNPEAVAEPHTEGTLAKYRHTGERGPYRLMGRNLKGSPIRAARDINPKWEQTHPELTFRHYLKDGRPAVDYWQIDIENQASHLRTAYPTQKPLALLEKIVAGCSEPGALVADLTCGSGTTAVAAARLGRAFTAADVSPMAVACTRYRILTQASPTGPAPEFTVHGPGLLAPAPEPTPVTFRGGRLHLDGAFAATTLLWAADPAWRPGQVFEPTWVAARPHRKGDLAPVSAPITPSRSGRGAILTTSAEFQDRLFAWPA